MVGFVHGDVGGMTVAKVAKENGRCSGRNTRDRAGRSVDGCHVRVAGRQPAPHSTGNVNGSCRCICVGKCREEPGTERGEHRGGARCSAHKRGVRHVKHTNCGSVEPSFNINRREDADPDVSFNPAKASGKRKVVDTCCVGRGHSNSAMGANQGVSKVNSGTRYRYTAIQPSVRVERLGNCGDRDVGTGQRCKVVQRSRSIRGGSEEPNRAVGLDAEQTRAVFGRTSTDAANHVAADPRTGSSGDGLRSRINWAVIHSKLEDTKANDGLGVHGR